MTLFEDDRHLAEGLFVREIWMTLCGENMFLNDLWVNQPVVQIQVCTVSRELKAKMFEDKSNMLFVSIFLHQYNNSQTRSPNTATQKLSCV